MVEKQSHQNRILSLLPREEVERLAPCLEPAKLEFKQMLQKAGAPMDHVYFPLSGVASRLACTEGEMPVEVATIGHEGLVGVCGVLGADKASASVTVQVPGEALRMKVSDLRVQAYPDSTIMRVIHRYMAAFLMQITQSVACNTFHSVEKRFCRWLLMAQDGTRSDRFPMTQDLIAEVLGVRRASVSDAARRLQAAGLIRYVHGKIAILDRPALESASCECYEIVKRGYDAQLASTP
jgi:CRP-like cAMP-binding protein